MHVAELAGFQATIHKTHEWLREIMDAGAVEHPTVAYGALRAVLHALRDRLTVEEAVQLGAQVPMLIRGLYYEGWRPCGKPAKLGKAEFLDAIRHQFPGPDRPNPETLARAVLEVLARHVSPGEVGDVKAILPAELRELWPGHGVRPAGAAKARG